MLGVGKLLRRRLYKLRCALEIGPLQRGVVEREQGEGVGRVVVEEAGPAARSGAGADIERAALAELALDELLRPPRRV